MAHNNPYGSQNAAGGYRSFSYGGGNNNHNSNQHGNGRNPYRGGSRLQPASAYHGGAGVGGTQTNSQYAHPMEDETPQQPRQHYPQQQSQQQQQQPDQQALIDELRRQLEEKAEENFDLSASLAAIQVETDAKIADSQEKSTKEISKLKEELRRAHQDANRARSALKKQQQQPQPQPTASSIARPPHQSPVPVRVRPEAVNSPFEQANRGPRLALGESHPKPHAKPSNGSISPSPAGRKLASRSAAPTDSSTAKRTSAVPIPTYSSSSILAQKLLQNMPSSSGHNHQQVHALLSRAISDNTTCASLPNNHQDVPLIWDLVQQSVDYSNDQALSVLERALLWSPDGCRALVEAAGWKQLSQETNENMELENNRPTITISSSKSSIRLGNARKRQLGRLEAISSKLKQPLGLSSSSRRTAGPLTNAHSKVQNTTPSSQQTRTFSPKQQLLARQLVARLSEAIACPPSNNYDPSSNNASLPLKISLGILARLFSSCDGKSYRPSAQVLEPAMVGIVFRLESHRKIALTGGRRIRGYDPLPRSNAATTTTAATTRTTAVDVEMKAVDDTKAENAQKPVGVSANKKPTTQAPSRLQLTAELEPMLCEVCRQIHRFLPVVASDGENSAKSTNEFVHQWRKTVLANACDILEGSLLPYLLKLSNPKRINDNAPSEVVVASWKEWIPWLSCLIQDSNGRQLLRTQFPLIERTTSTATKGKESASGGDDTSSTKPSSQQQQQAKSQGVDVSCSAMGVVVQLFYASAMLEQCQVRDLSPEVLSLCRTLQSQAVRCIHDWLQCHESRKRSEICLLDLVSEFLEFYKSACAWILHQGDVGSSSAVDLDCVVMVEKQAEDLVLDEDERLREREKLYKKKGRDT